jgi:hypothetical protein
MMAVCENWNNVCGIEKKVREWNVKWDEKKGKRSSES